MILFLIDKLLGAIVALPLILTFLFVFDKKRLQKKWPWVVLFVVYMNAMLIIVGIPYATYIRWDPTLNLIPFQDFSSSNILGMGLNILMFVPFGAFLPIYFKRFRKLVITACAGASMSLIIELLQLFVLRATDIDDFIMNTIGSVVGYLIGTLIVRFFAKEEECHYDVLILVSMITLSILVVVFINGPLSAFVFGMLYD